MAERESCLGGSPGVLLVNYTKQKMSEPGTRKKLLSIIEDVEIVSKELLEYLSTPKAQRPEDIDMTQLVSLLTQKDTAIQETLKIAMEQGEQQKKMDSLKAEVERRDQDIKQLQKNLKEAETVLATAIFQAKQKLDSMNQASSKRISSEELIKYAHKISASNAVAAPPTWQPGDPRRPYPTDMDMRMGWLCRRGDHITSPALQSQVSYTDGLRPDHTLGEHSIPTVGSSSGASTLSWQHSFESSIQPNAGGATSSFPHTITPTVSMDNKSSREPEDVEMMTSDSSSSSSSDE